MKFKKSILALGSVVTVAAPVAAVISCGSPDSSQYSENDLLKMSNLKSTEAHSKLQDLWLAKVLKNVYGINAKTLVLDDEGKEVTDSAGKPTYREVGSMDILRNLDNTTSGDEFEADGVTPNPDYSKFENDFKETLRWVLENKLFSSKDALSTLYQSLKSNAPDEVVNSTPTSGVERYAVKALNAKVFDRDNIVHNVNEVMKGVEWKDLFFNFTVNDKNEDIFNPSILGIKDLVLKMMITKKYLSLSKKELKETLPDDYSKIDSKYRDTTLVSEDAGFFPLVVSTMNSRLAYKTSIELPANKSKEFIFSNVDNILTHTEAKEIFSNLKSKFLDKLTYTIKSETRVDEILAKIPSFVHTKPGVTVGFKGLSTLPSGKDALNTGSVSSIQHVKTDTARDGFVVTSKADGTKIITDDHDVRFTDEDKTKVEVNYYTSLMPVYDDTAKTLGWGSGVDLDKLMNEAYTKDTSLYSSAIKYFTADVKDGDKVIHEPILINVTNDWARNYYIDEGLTYVNKEKQ